MSYAFVTLVTSDAYLPGALVVASALRDVHPSPAEPPEVDFQTVCLVSPETVDVKTIKLLRRAFDIVVGVEVISIGQTGGLHLLGRPDLDTVLTKLHTFRLTQFDKVIFLDADILPVRPLSHLFALPHDFAAVPDVGWPDIFNSGVMVFSPSEDKFNQIMDVVRSRGSWDGGDQGVLNEWRGNDWHRLSFTYNTTPTAAYTYAPAYERFGNQISAIHFIGPTKPWASIPYRAPSSQPSQSSASTSQSYGYSSLVDRWFDVYDSHFRPVEIAQHQEHEIQKYVSAWNDSTETLAPSDVLGLDDLKRLAIEGVGASGIVGHAHPAHGEGTYHTLPLEGRVDLMRPAPATVEDAAQPLEDAAQPIRASGVALTVQEPGIQAIDGAATYSAADPVVSGVLVYNVVADTVQGRSAFTTPRHTPRLQLGSGLPLHSSPEYRSHTLPTPAPHEVPPAPLQRTYSLPPESPLSPGPTRHYDYFQAPIYHGEHLQSSSQTLELLREPTQDDQVTVEQMSYSQAPSQAPSPQVYPPEVRSQQVHHQQVHQQVHPQQAHPQQVHPQQAHQQVHSQQVPQQTIPTLQHDLPQEALRQQVPVEWVPTASAAHGQSMERVYQPPPSPPRPSSPPKISWNPAIEPPPRTPPPATHLPVESYFPNAWDLPRSPPRFHRTAEERHVYHDQQFFQAPPPTKIPSQLVQQGHYTAVTSQAPHPQPDRKRVATVFPWEEQRRHAPTRYFPRTDSPPPGLPYLEPPPPPPAAPAVTRTFASPPSSPQSYRSGMPLSMQYLNAWDTVPAIQKYATRLMRPPQPPPTLHDPAGRHRRRHSEGYPVWEEVEESSRDGDVESDDDDLSDIHSTFGELESSASDGKDGAGSITVTSPTTSIAPSLPTSARPGPSKVPRSRRGSRTLGTSDMKQYKSQSTQTPIKEMRERGVQAVRTRRAQAPRLSPTTLDADESKALTSEVQMSATPGAPAPGLPPPVSGNFDSPGGGAMSPRLHDSYAFGSLTLSPKQSPGQTMPQVAKAARASQSPIASPPSGSLSRLQRLPSEDVVLSSGSTETPSSPQPGVQRLPRKAAGRMWDPARGVDVFKRGSEEVLARFLRMDSWEDSPPKKHSSPTSAV